MQPVWKFLHKVANTQKTTITYPLGRRNKCETKRV